SHGRAYALLATAAHVAGGLIWRGRALIQRKDFIDPAHYLYDMSAHALRWAVSGFRPVTEK
ncbi:MAG: glycosyltransferase family 2 protein, partial [Paracoccaceae bacterium]